MREKARKDDRLLARAGTNLSYREHLVHVFDQEVLLKKFLVSTQCLPHSYDCYSSSLEYESYYGPCLPQVYIPLKKACEDVFVRQGDVESFITELEAR